MLTSVPMERKMGMLNAETMRTVPLGSATILGPIAKYEKLNGGFCGAVHFPTLSYASLTSLYVGPMSNLDEHGQHGLHAPAIPS